MSLVDDTAAADVSVSAPFFDGDTYTISSEGMEVSLRPPLGQMGWLVSVEQAFSPDMVPNLVACLKTAHRISTSEPTT